MHEESLRKLYSNGHIYDKENEVFHDIPFWINLVKSTDARSFLELCCGTGRIGKHLLPHLDTYHGIDMSQPFLNYFQQQVESPCADFALINGMIQTTNLGRTYAIVAIPFNSMSHMYNLDDISKAMNAVKAHMSNESSFVFDIHNPSLELLSRSCNDEIEIKKFTGSDGVELSVLEKSRYDKRTQINTVFWRYVTPDGEVKTELTLPMRVFFPMEMDAHLEHHGFKILQKLGSFEGEEFTSQSRKQIYICQRD